MAGYKIISDRSNTFFTNNNITIGTAIPTSGTYSKGDIVVNVGSTSATAPMWICNEGGTPGVWGLVGVGGGGSGTLVSMNETVTVNNPVTEVSLGELAGLVSSKDKLSVHFNSTHLMQDVDFKISEDGAKIIKLTEGSWNESGIAGSMFAFELLKNVENIEGGNVVLESKLTSITNNVIVGTRVNEVEIGIAGFNKADDMLMVFKNSTFMVEGIDYNISNDSTKILNVNGVWNESGLNDYNITFVVFKEVAIIDSSTLIGTGNIKDGSITLDKLADDIKSDMNAIDDFISIVETHTDSIEYINTKLDELENKEVDLTGYATVDALEAVEDKIDNIDLTGKQDVTDNSLATTDKTIVGAINELFQSANNGKELIANAIGEPVSADDTFQAMSDDINGLLATFKANMMNNGVTVESGDRFKALIDKIATLADNEGKGIQYAEGEGTLSSSTYSTSITSLSFLPSYVFCYFNYAFGNTSVGYYVKDAVVSNLGTLTLKTSASGNGSTGPSGITIAITNISNVGFTVTKSSTTALLGDMNFTWYAIGVGEVEEDTTLRDSLASILTEEGVEVTDEDDMASLISKVDSEFDNQVVPAGTAVASNVLSGKTFINSTGSTITGTMANRGGAQTITPSTSNKTLSSGYYSGAITVKGDANLKPENILSGISIFGVTGTAETLNFASGTATMVGLADGFYGIEVTGLDFKPKLVYGYASGAFGSVTRYYVGCSYTGGSDTCLSTCYGLEDVSSYNGITSTGFTLRIMYMNLPTTPSYECYWVAIG